jgi:hypothetical protein
MAKDISKKGLTLSKLQTWLELSKEGILTADRLAVAVKDGIDKGEIVAQTEEVFSAQSAELLEFAKSLNLIKTKSAPFGGGKKGKDYEDYIRAQYPETVPMFDAIKTLTSKSYEITTDAGDKLTVQPLPFCRNITPKPAKSVDASAPVESSVTV